MGKCSKIKATFEIKDNAVSVFKPKLFLLLLLLNKDLDRFENLGVISLVDYSEWSAPTVYVKKKNKIRVCADYYTRLNDSLKTLNHPLLFPENIFMNLNVEKFFSKINLSDVYLQIEVDESCKKLPSQKAF